MGAEEDVVAVLLLLVADAALAVAVASSVETAVSAASLLASAGVVEVALAVAVASSVVTAVSAASLIGLAWDVDVALVVAVGVSGFELTGVEVEEPVWVWEEPFTALVIPLMRESNLASRAGRLDIFPCTK